MKNVARTYFLEHEGEALLFDQLFKLLNSNLLNEETYRRELASSTGALRTTISQHMFKEEEQVYFNHLYLGCVWNGGKKRGGFHGLASCVNYTFLPHTKHTLRSSLVVLSEEVLWFMKSISQFFLFGKPKSWGAFTLGF